MKSSRTLSHVCNIAGRHSAMSDLAAGGAAVPIAPMQHAKRRWAAGRDALTAAILLLPSVLLLLAFTYWPLVEVTWRSLNQARFGQPPSLGLGNYARMLTDPHFARAATNNARPLSRASRPLLRLGRHQLAW